MNQKYLIKLTTEERQQLEQLLSSGDAPARTLKHAFILLKSDCSEAGSNWLYSKICEAFDVASLTVFNTHSPASFYETFEPSEALRLANRFEFHYTPKHGSWLNMAEIEMFLHFFKATMLAIPASHWRWLARPRPLANCGPDRQIRSVEPVGWSFQAQEAPNGDILDFYCLPSTTSAH